MSRTRVSSEKKVVAGQPASQRPAIDPIQPLADAVARGIQENLLEIGSSSSAFSKMGGRLSVLIAKVLQESLTQDSAGGKALRMALITKLAGAEMSPVRQPVPAQASRESPDLLSTAQAAAILGMSRPYITMLCDSGKLGPIEVTDGGHRRIPRDGLERYRLQSAAQHHDAPGMREAGVEAGLYDHDDSHYTNVVRTRQKPRKPAKNSIPDRKVRP
ncbi:helix-turn-helix domain-containing protein [Xylophilus sp. GOD-11R]|uniref:helix-turn-helix domain-containing protein n=1 Tax=Xylophilus sp. GOD-11R TaxID=3089814 RepID=UPI00298D161C|nr:helix-turn-helix domain-containing protein [Xylophilus sp. GOD-11R]WPB55457.1 helix-turn-helix domain-containing protein [Xylophilus sp. GOD-11R]